MDRDAAKTVAAAGYIRGELDSAIRLDRDWGSAVEAAYAPARDDAEWVALVRRSTKDLFRAEIGNAVIVVEHTGDCASAKSLAMSFPEEHRAIFDFGDGGHSIIGQAGFRAMYYPPLPAITHAELKKYLEPSARRGLDPFFENAPFREAVGVLSHPTPGRIICLTAAYRRSVRLTARERAALTRLALHLEAGYRLRHHPEIVRAVLDANGTVVHRESDAPGRARLEAHGQRLVAMQSQRTGDSLELWPALLAGRLSIVGRGRGKSRRYLVLENPLASQSYRALSKQEVDVLSEASRGLSSKMIAFALGLAPSAVSQRLAQVATKLGAASRIELVRIAAMLNRDPRAGIASADLTAAEAEVLALLQEGLSNDQIAKVRLRSVRTIANQVASLLRKTGSTARPDLVSRR